MSSRKKSRSRITKKDLAAVNKITGGGITKAMVKDWKLFLPSELDAKVYKHLKRKGYRVP